MSLTDSKTVYRVGYQPLMSGVTVAPFAYCHHCPCQPTDGTECCLHPSDKLKSILKMQTAPEETAAIIVEPVLGEGGYVAAPLSFMQALRKICTENNILLIFDEVQSGFGRTGKWFAFEHYGIVPDILVMAKGIANGLPLSGIIAREELHKKWVPGSHGGTYGGNAVACAAAVETINTIRDEKVLENTIERGEQLMQGLKKLQKEHPKWISDVRGKGLMIGLEFDRNVVEKGTSGAIIRQCLKNGMFLLSTGAFEAVRFIPPLTVSKSEIDEGLAIFEKSLMQVLFIPITG